MRAGKSAKFNREYAHGQAVVMPNQTFVCFDFFAIIAENQLKMWRQNPTQSSNIIAIVCAFTFLLVHAVLIGALLVVLRDIFHCRKWMETITYNDIFEFSKNDKLKP